MNNSSGAIYLQRTCFQRLDYYFWPYEAVDRLGQSVFVHRYVMLLYRLLALLFIALSIVMAYFSDPVHCFAYIEVWSAITAFAMYSLMLINYFCNRLWKYTHFLFELTWCLQLGFTVIFWAFLYGRSYHTQLIPAILLHGGILLVITLDYFNNAIYFYRRHLRLVLLVAVVYICVNIPVTLVVFRVYRSLTYDDAWTVLGIVVGLVFIILAFIAGALMDRWKYFYIRKWEVDKERLVDDDRNSTVLEDSGGGFYP